MRQFITILFICNSMIVLGQLSHTPNQMVSIALLQINPVGANVEENLEKGDEYCRVAKDLGADIILFPEMWSIGYSGYYKPGSDYSKKENLSFEEWKAKAISINSDYIKHFQDLAKELGVAIVITYLEEKDGTLRNSASVISTDGRILMTYAKVHSCDFSLKEVVISPGDDFYVCNVPVKGESVRVGVMICYDREFPESARILMLKGAELILTPNACILEEQRINQFQTRAFENAVGIAMANYPQPFLNGYSCAFNSNGQRIFMAGKKEGVFIATFDMKEIRTYRGKTIQGNAFRRPQKYHLLMSPKVDTVFIRENALGEKFDRSNR